MPTRNADATWNGALRDGNDTFKTESGAVERAYSFSFSSRFEDDVHGITTTVESGQTTPEPAVNASSQVRALR